MISIDRRSFLQCLAPAGLGLMAGTAAFAARDKGKLIQVGAQTNTWGAPIKGYDHLLEILDTLVKLGYTGFETNYISLEPEAARAADCRRAFESRHIQYVAPHGNVRFIQGLDEKQELDSIQKIASYSAAMGATHFIASGTFPRANGSQQQMGIPAMADLMNKVGRVCQKEGLKFSYHNHVHEFQGNPPEMEALLRATDPAVVWMNYDIGNAFPVGPKPEDFSAEHFRRISIYHIKDVKEGPVPGKSVPTDLGAGSLNIKGVVAPLLKHKWRGWLVVERESNYPKPAEHPEELLKQCRDYLRNTIGV